MDPVIEARRIDAATDRAETQRELEQSTAEAVLLLLRVCKCDDAPQLVRLRKALFRWRLARGLVSEREAWLAEAEGD